jgi:hypothetical protein
LKEAADVISESPAALQLRYLQTLNSIAAEKNSTIVFPVCFVSHKYYNQFFKFLFLFYYFYFRFQWNCLKDFLWKKKVLKTNAN